jgi:hypothetical protein
LLPKKIISAAHFCRQKSNFAAQKNKNVAAQKNNFAAQSNKFAAHFTNSQNFLPKAIFHIEESIFGSTTLQGMPLQGFLLDFVTEPYTEKGICRVLRYERREGGSKMPIFALRNKRTFPRIIEKQYSDPKK